MMDRDSTTRTGARTPGAEDYPSSTAVHYRAHGPARYGIADVGHEMHEGRRQTGRRSAHAGSRLKLIDVREGPAWKASLPAVSGKPAVRKLRPVRLVCSAGDRPAREKVRSPVVWMAGWRGVQNPQGPEAHRQGLPWGDHESPGRNNSKRNVASKGLDPRAEPASVGRRQHEVPKSDRCGTFHLGGVKATAR